MLLYVAIPALHEKLLFDIKLFIHYYYTTRQSHTYNLPSGEAVPRNYSL